MNLDKIKSFFEEYFKGNQVQGTIRIIFDVGILLCLLFMLFYLIRQKVNVIRVFIVVISCLILYIIALMFELIILTKFMEYIGSWVVGFIIIVYSQDIKLTLEGKNKDKKGSGFSSKKEKQEIINVICSTVDYLSKRKIGAIITFERRDSLDSLIEKAIQIHADITQEILTTIFTPGTACHDGGVIIQNNKIACAGAYYPLSDNYDIPKFLGTRHRAAIGMSEKYDAITVIVSEETGNISIAIAGNINLELTLDRVGVLLDGYLNAK